MRSGIADHTGMLLGEFDRLSGYASLQSAMTYAAAGQLYYAVTPQQAAGPYDHAWHWYDAAGQRFMSHLATSSTLDLDIRPDSAWGTRTYYQATGAATYHGTTERLLSRVNGVGSDTFVYDRAGNLTTRVEATGETWHYTYNALNQLTTVVYQDTLVGQYAYDVLGRRIAKSVPFAVSGGGVTNLDFVYHGTQIAFERTPAGTITMRYTWGPGVDHLVAVRDGAGTHYYVRTDELGSVRTLIRRDGTWLLTQRFSPYGEVIERDTSAALVIGANLRHRWTGREYDAETGFYFHRARYFLPAIRRWTQEDPIGYAGGGNLYAYVGGAPLEATDTNGLAPGYGGGTNGWLYADWYPTPPAKSGWDGWFGISGTLLPALYTVVSDGRTAVWIPGRVASNLWIADDYEKYVAAFEENKQALQADERPILEAGDETLTVGEMWASMDVLGPDQFAMAVGFSLRDGELRSRIQARFGGGQFGVGDLAPDFWAAANGRASADVWAATAGGWTSLRGNLFTGGPLHNMIVHESLHVFNPTWNEGKTCFEANRHNVGRVACF